MAIVRNIQNNCFYRYLGENVFENLVTGQKGKIEDEKAREVFRINLDLTKMVEENPLVAELIKRCNLKIDPKTFENGNRGNQEG